MCVFVSVCTVVHVAASPSRGLPFPPSVQCYCPVNARVKQRLKHDPLTEQAWVTQTQTESTCLSFMHAPFDHIADLWGAPMYKHMKT